MKVATHRESAPLPVRSINHVSRVCRDVESSVRFYSQILGFVRIQRPSSFDFDGAWLFQYGLGVHLIEGEPPERPSAISPKADHLSFQSDSLQLVEERLNSLGIPYKKASVVENGIRVMQIFLHDPDNNMIEICNCDCLPIRPLTSCATSHASQQNVVCPTTPRAAEPIGAFAESSFVSRRPIYANSAA